MSVFDLRLKEKAVVFDGCCLVPHPRRILGGKAIGCNSAETSLNYDVANSTRSFPFFRRLPKRLKPHFWEYGRSHLSPLRDSSLIIARLLAASTWESARWLRNTMGDEALRHWLRQHRGQGLPPQVLRFWELILDLDHRMVSSWIRKNRSNPWNRRAHL